MANKIDGAINLENESNEESLVDFHNQIFAVQEKERHRIARDLHDSSLQNLAHLVHKLELCSLYMDSDIIRAKLELASIQQNLKSVIEEIRNTIFDLRPMSFDDLGLKETIERMLYHLQETSDFKVTYDIDEVSCENVMVPMNIYRFIQEACNNVVKHADATELIVKMKKSDDFINIIVQDNGVGFDTHILHKENHFGISVMQERIDLLKGSFEIFSEIGKGTKLSVIIPVVNN